MELNDYAARAQRTALYEDAVAELMARDGVDVMKAPNIFKALCMSYVILGLVGEAGEVANVYKKVLRRGEAFPPLDAVIKIGDEGGDVLWYEAALANELMWTLNNMATRNLEKLRGRQDAGTVDATETRDE